jgi:PAS domain S-box-containing protein
MVSSKGKKASGKISAQKKKSAPAEPVGEQAVRKLPEKVIDSTGDVLDQVENYAIILLDAKGNIKSWNKGAEKIKGYKADEIIGRNYRIFYSKEDRDARLSDNLLAKARQEGNTSYEGWRIRKDGSRFWGSMTLTAIVDGDGEVRRFLKITRDLTEKKVTEDKLSNYLEQLTFKNEELKKSEERYHQMVAEVQDYAIILLSKDGTVLDWNLGAQKLKGYTPNEIIGKNFRMFYPVEEKKSDLPGRLLLEAERNGSVLHEGWRVRKDGTRFWGMVVITALHAGDGQIIGFSKVTRDLTARKIADDRMNNIVEELQQANDRLRESEERYHKMIDEVQDYAIVLLSNSGEVLNWNAGASFIKGYDASEIVGKNFRLFYTQRDRENGLPEQLLDAARRHGRVVHEGWRVRKDGTEFWGSVVITALHNSSGGIIGFSKVTRDLTERRQAEELLKTSAAQLDVKNKTLERLNSELSSFSYVASHDLKEPLRKIQTFAARMENLQGLSESHLQYIEKIMQSASRMQKLINDLLAYSEVSSDDTVFDRVDLNQILLSVKNDLEVLIQEKKGVIKSKALPVVNGVPHQFHQLFFNLLSNALKFSREGVPPVIQIDCRIIRGPELAEMNEKGNKYHLISFKDNGIGFEEEFASKIFQAFQRLHSKHEFSGTGIGLAIVKKVVENHGGVVEARSTIGSGSVFDIYLPITDA